MKEPLPELKMTWRGEVLKYADGTTKTLSLKDNTLFSIVMEKSVI